MSMNFHSIHSNVTIQLRMEMPFLIQKKKRKLERNPQTFVFSIDNLWILLFAHSKSIDTLHTNSIELIRSSFARKANSQETKRKKQNKNFIAKCAKLV